MSNATIMVISVTASTTQGQLLTEEELERIYEACNMAEELLAAKMKILNYVESRMAFIAPNVTAIVGMRHGLGKRTLQKTETDITVFDLA